MATRTEIFPLRYTLAKRSGRSLPSMRLFFRKAWCWLAIARQRYRTRQQLAQLDDRALQDIGLSRADACQEAEKPFWRE